MGSVAESAGDGPSAGDGRSTKGLRPARRAFCADDESTARSVGERMAQAPSECGEREDVRLAPWSERISGQSFITSERIGVPLLYDETELNEP